MIKPIKKFLGDVSMVIELSAHSIKLTHHDSHSWIATEKLSFSVDEPPIQSVPNFAPISLCIVTHF